MNTDSEPEYDDYPNAPELSEDNLEHDEEVNKLLNYPENDKVMALSSLLNFPDLLKLNTSGKHKNNSDAEDSDNEHYPLSHSRRDRQKSPIATGDRSEWTYTPLVR